MSTLADMRADAVRQIVDRIIRPGDDRAALETGAALYLANAEANG